MSAAEAATASSDGPRSSSFGSVARRWAIAGLLVLSAIQVAIFHRSRHDDAFISYRYAENVARGRGMVFNPGERVMGSTAPGHVLVAALVHRVAGHEQLPSVMSALGTLGWMAQALAVAVLLAPVFGEGVAGLAALLVALGLAGSGRWVALETNLVVALELWALVVALRGQVALAGLLAGFAALTRPDALVFLVLLLVWTAFRHRRRVIAAAAAAAGVLLPWAIFAQLYFGSALPQSARAKFQVTPFATYLAHTLRHPARSLLPEAAFLGELGVALAWLLAIGGALVLVRRRRELWILPAFFLAHAAAYLYLRPFTPHAWHLYPTTLLFALFLLVAVCAALERPQRLLRAVAAVAAVALIAGSVWRLRGAPQSLESPYFRGRHDAYVAIAELLRERARPGDSVMAVEVGTVAYYSDVAMLDLGLLVTRREGADRRANRFMMFDRLYWNLFEEGVRGLAYFQFRSGEFEAFLFDLETPENRETRARQRRQAAAEVEAAAEGVDAQGAEPPSAPGAGPSATDQR